MGVVIPDDPDRGRRPPRGGRLPYPPAGRRSFGPVRVGLRDGPTYFKDANSRVLVIPMIETAEALADVDAIARTPGVDALFVGPFDLSIALGLAPGDNDGEAVFDEAIERVRAASRSAGCGRLCCRTPPSRPCASARASSWSRW